jgi:hypothetical protein
MAPQKRGFSSDPLACTIHEFYGNNDLSHTVLVN